MLSISHLHLGKGKPTHTTVGGLKLLNVFLDPDPEWIVVIPRTQARRDREGVGANVAGMMGAIWLKDQGERMTRGGG